MLALNKGAVLVILQISIELTPDQQISTFGRGEETKEHPQCSSRCRRQFLHAAHQIFLFNESDSLKIDLEEYSVNRRPALNIRKYTPILINIHHRQIHHRARISGKKIIHIHNAPSKIVSHILKIVCIQPYVLSYVPSARIRK